MKTNTISLIVLWILILTGDAVAQLAPGCEFRMTKPRASRERIYEDSFIRIEFAILSSITFKLTNKTDDAIEVNWASVSYVDPKGNAHKVIHEGVRYIERDRALPPTVIPPTASITDLIHPTDYITYESGREGGWKMTGILEPFAIPFPLSGGETLSVLIGDN